MHARTRWLPRPLIMLSALGICLSFGESVPGIWVLLWVCLIPWLQTVESCQHARDVVIQGVWLSWLVTHGSFFWVARALHEYGELSWPLSVLGCELFALISQPQWIVLGLMRHYAKAAPRHLGWVCAFSLIYAGVDWYLPKLFADTLGHGFYQANHLRQLADLGGAPLLSFLAVGMNVSLWELGGRLGTLRSRAKPLIVFILLVGLGELYGLYRIHTLRQGWAYPVRSVRVAAIQANITDVDKVAARRGYATAMIQVIEAYTRLSDQALEMRPPPEVLIWPETAYPSTFGHPHSRREYMLDQHLEQFVRQSGVPLIFGGYDENDRWIYNSLFTLSPQGRVQVYHKDILLPFGDYIPGAYSIDWIRENFPQVGNFGPGQGAQVLRVHTPAGESMELAPVICYEALFPRHTQKGAWLGAEAIVNLTNDSWFGSAQEARLHLALSVFRSLETRLPQLRATNTGISALITPFGEITHATALRQPAIMHANIPLRAPPWTLVGSVGQFFPALALSLGALPYLVWWIRRRAHA